MQETHTFLYRQLHHLNMAFLGTLCLLLCGITAAVGSSELEGCDSGAQFVAQDLDVSSFHDGKSTVPRYYRYIMVDTLSQSLLVGAMNRIYGLSLTNVTDKASVRKKDLSPNRADVGRCKIQGKKELPDCQNHIRFIARNTSSSNTLYVCGTGSYNPTSYQLSVPVNDFLVLSHSSGIGMCPYDPFDNATALFVEESNPGDIPGQYSGTVTDFIKADPILFRPDLYHRNGTMAVGYVRTQRNDPKWLNEPQFVGSFDVGNQVYFFFREVALEYTNCGKKIYSRVAKVCKNDKGGKAVLNHVWTSYLKARLNCSIPGEYPYYFDEIQDVYSVDGQTFYGLFTTNVNGLTASAICAFTVHQIERAFNGPFKDQTNSKSNWLPVPEVEVPDPRPGNCSVDDTRSLPDTVINFIKSHPLMDQAVAHQYGRPIFYKGNCLMQRLAVASNVSGHGELVFYTASNTGLVYKIFAWPSESTHKAPHSILSTIFKPFESVRPVWSMKLHGKYVYLGTDISVTQLKIEICQKYMKVDQCLYDPYCGWDRDAGICRSGSTYRKLVTYRHIDRTMAWEAAIEDALGQPLYNSKSIWKATGSSLTLRVEYKLNIEGLVTWTKNGSHVQSDRHILAHDNSLVIPDLTAADQGVYRAADTKNRLVAEYAVSVDTTKEEIEQRWIRKFDEWCHEFEKYQNDIRIWENKCSSCCQSPGNAISQFGGK
ncbi:semaphorin-2A-like [Haliotis rufescens]|uniref:semaphorin-2A-like n=1 Tax=Haliotis rufescens TaxID=6454 RepID=UPI001EAFA1E9|nr:semaphorin-2A-like [Haliotis rufescens]XP_046350873.1 semaphorin-2A-like [Haliotis rufescens]